MSVLRSAALGGVALAAAAAVSIVVLLASGASPLLALQALVAGAAGDRFALTDRVALVTGA